MKKIITNNSRIKQIFTTNKNVLIPFITAGYPKLTTTLPLLHEMAKSGAKVIEIGIPFSDPMADGPVIEAAGNIAIDNGANLAWILSIVREFRETNNENAVVLMGYQNSFEQFENGFDGFVKVAAKSGVDGVLIVDSPPEESQDAFIKLSQNNINLIRLISPTTNSKRIKKIIKSASGYLYFISLKGVTGSKVLDIKTVAGQIVNLRKYTKLSIAVGFGIRDKQNVSAIFKHSEGAIIGSKIIEIINTNIKKSDKQIANEVGKFIKEMIKE